jgi:hypothetical protein
MQGTGARCQLERPGQFMQIGVKKIPTTNAASQV